MLIAALLLFASTAAPPLAPSPLTPEQRASFAAFEARSAKIWADIRARRESDWRSISQRGVLDRDHWVLEQIEEDARRNRELMADYKRLYLALPPGQRATLDRPVQVVSTAPAAPATVELPPPSPGVSYAPSEPASFSTIPDPDSFADFYPLSAMQSRTLGKATLTCKITENGAFNTCKVDSESPEGMGFGNAAIQLTSLMRMHPATVYGRPVQSEKTFPVTVNLPD